MKTICDSLGKLPTLHPKPGHLLLTSSSPRPHFHSFLTFFFAFPPQVDSKYFITLHSSPLFLLPPAPLFLPNSYMPLSLSLPSSLLLTDSPLIIQNTHLHGSEQEPLAGVHSWAGCDHQEGVFHLFLSPRVTLLPDLPPPPKWRSKAHHLHSGRFCTLSLQRSLPKAKSPGRLKQPCSGHLNLTLAVARMSECSEAGRRRRSG